VFVLITVGIGVGCMLSAVERCVRTRQLARERAQRSAHRAKNIWRKRTPTDVGGSSQPTSGADDGRLGD